MIVSLRQSVCVARVERGVQIDQQCPTSPSACFANVASGLEPYKISTQAETELQFFPISRLHARERIETQPSSEAANPKCDCNRSKIASFSCGVTPIEPIP